MKTIINNIEFNNFGSNNYTDGMEMISVYPCPSDLVQRVLNGEFKGVYLNPSAPCTDEFFGVFGTEEQYQQFYKHQKKAQIAKAMMAKFGFNRVELEVWKEYEAKVKQSYKDWWE